MISQNPAAARALAQRGELRQAAGDYANALLDFTQALALAPDYGWALAHRGDVYRKLGQSAAALADFERALALNPHSVWTRAHRGAAYVYLRRPAPALADLDQALAATPNYAWALIYRAEAWILLKHYAKALADVDRAVGLDTNLVYRWRGERGMLLNYLGRYQETMASCAVALQEDANDYVALYSFVVAKMHEAKTHEQGLPATQTEVIAAERLLRATLQTAQAATLRASLLYRLGGLAALQGHCEQALACLQQATALDDEPKEQARHDPAWQLLRADVRFLALLAQPVE
jgi:tetratricopeptide (TPR) repeat protein